MKRDVVGSLDRIIIITFLIEGSIFCCGRCFCSLLSCGFEPLSWPAPTVSTNCIVGTGYDPFLYFSCSITVYLLQPWYDARLVYEAFFAGACIVAFWRLFYFLQMSRMIGPTVVSSVLLLSFMKQCHSL